MRTLPLSSVNGSHAGPEDIRHGAEHDSGREPDPVHERDDLDWMLAQFGQGRHHLGGMVDLVELPKRRDLVKGVVGGPIGELVSQDLQHGREREDRPGRREDRRVRPECARQPGDDGVAPEEEAKAQHAIGGSEYDRVQNPQAHVDERRGMEEDAAGKNRAQEAPRADPPAPRPAAPDIIERGKGQRAAKRRTAIGGRRAESRLDRALQGRPDGEGMGHGFPRETRLTEKRLAPDASQMVRGEERKLSALFTNSGQKGRAWSKP